MADATIADLAAVTDLIGTDEYILMRAGVSKKIDASDLASEINALGGGGGLFDAYALIRDEKGASVDGGTFTSGAWRTRDLNTEVYDGAGIVSISANQFTLAAGAYLIRARAPAHGCNWHKTKLRNITDSTDALIGSNATSLASTSGNDWSFCVGRISIAGSKAFELQHQCHATKATNGFGVNTNFGVVEVYAEVEIWREA